MGLAKNDRAHLLLAEPTEGIPPSIILDICCAIGYLREMGEMAFVMVDPHFEFARDLADDFAAMDRSEIVRAGSRAELEAADVQRHLAN